MVKAAQIKYLEEWPSYFKGKTRPVEQVSWDDIQLFNKTLKTLFESNKVTFMEFKKPEGAFGLPSETQWEYTANADQGLIFAGSQNPDDVAWYKENSNGQTMPVGLKQPNAWGLFDMSGNVWQWSADDYIVNLNEIAKNGLPNFEKGRSKALRGGSYFIIAGDCRLRSRRHYHPVIRSCGFRLVFSPSSSVSER